MYSKYFQANVRREYCWFFVAVLRSYEHVALDRTIDKQESLFEFFVSPDMYDEFQGLMYRLSLKGIVSNLVEMPNRLINSALL
jgi:hypothetical protein